MPKETKKAYKEYNGCSTMNKTLLSQKPIVPTPASSVMDVRTIAVFFEPEKEATDWSGINYGLRGKRYIGHSLKPFDWTVLTDWRKFKVIQSFITGVRP